MLHGWTAEALFGTRRGVDPGHRRELQVAVIGLDGDDVPDAARQAPLLAGGVPIRGAVRDMLSQKPDGRLELDYARLHDTVPAPI